MKRSPSPDSPVSSSVSLSPSPSPVAPIAPSQPRTLPPSSMHFIQFNMGSKLLADSHAEVDLKGQTLRRAGLDSSKKSDSEGDAVAQPEMKYISETKPRPAASSIPKAKENNTLKHGAAVKAQNGEHLYHERSQGKMKRLEEADRAFMEMMKAKQNGTTSSTTTTATTITVKRESLGAFTSPLFAAPSPSPSPSSSSSISSYPTPSPIASSPTDSEEESEEARKARKAEKKAKKEAKRKARGE